MSVTAEREQKRNDEKDQRGQASRPSESPRSNEGRSGCCYTQPKRSYPTGD